VDDVTHERLSVDQLCFLGDTIDEFVAGCRELGVRHVVLNSAGLLAEGGFDAARRALGDDGPRVEAVNHPFALFPDLERDTGEASAHLLRLVDMAAELGARSVYLLTGSRGSLSWEDAADRFTELVAPGREAASARGIEVLIENAPSLYADIHIAHSLADTITLAERSGLGVCIELQFCWADAGLDDLLRRAMPRCGLVQVSDYVLGDRSLPARAVPGDGAIPLARILEQVLAAGYEGVFDIELLGPRIEAEGHLAATRRAVEHVEAIFASLGL
jgi:sugar phosphate isomerase/epimerase